jgi:hypothetical protein
MDYVTNEPSEAEIQRLKTHIKKRKTAALYYSNVVVDLVQPDQTYSILYDSPTVKWNLSLGPKALIYDVDAIAKKLREKADGREVGNLIDRAKIQLLLPAIKSLVKCGFINEFDNLLGEDFTQLDELGLLSDKALVAGCEQMLVNSKGLRDAELWTDIITYCQDKFETLKAKNMMAKRMKYATLLSHVKPTVYRYKGLTVYQFIQDTYGNPATNIRQMLNVRNTRYMDFT